MPDDFEYYDDLVITEAPMHRFDDPTAHLGRAATAAAGLSMLVLLIFAVLKWLEIPTGSFWDWVIGLSSFWWLLVVVTIPWNVYFGASEVLDEIARSDEKDIFVADQDRRYARRMRTYSLLTALGLHVLSAAGFLALAIFGVTPIGYVGSAAALLLTGLRPAVRGYRYVAQKLYDIRRKVRYPRDDIQLALQKLSQHEEDLKRLHQRLSTSDELSWSYAIEKQLSDQGQELSTVLITQRDQSEELQARLTRLELQMAKEVQTLQTRQDQEREKLQLETRKALMQISEDSEFLGHVREIMRFVKEGLST